MEKEKNIYVFADFLSFHNEFLGTVHVSQTKGENSIHLNMMNNGWLRMPCC